MGRKLINDNLNTVLGILFDRLELKYKRCILRRMQEHPDFPSLLSIQHILKQEGVDSVALKTTIEEFRNELPKPVLIHVATNIDLFLLVNRIDESNVHIINEYGEIELEPINSFTKIWDGNAMIFDSENIVPQVRSFREKVLLLIDRYRLPFVLFVMLFLLVFFIVKDAEIRNTFSYLFLVLSAIGLLLSVLLVIESFDEYNPFIRRFCTSKKRRNVNCFSILNSKDARFLGILSWSDIGLVYFIYIFLLNLFNFSTINLAVTGILSSLAFPYVFYSITYQKFVARSWCRLCIGIQSVFTIMFIVSILLFRSITFGAYWPLSELIPIILLLLAIIATYITIKPLIAKVYEMRSITPKLRSLKHNVEVKKLLFSMQHRVISVSDCCIVLGNPQGETRIALVISPLCDPCVNELRILLPILKRKESTRIEIFFFVEKKEETPIAFNLAKSLIDIYLSNTDNFIDELYDYVNNYPSSKFKNKWLNHLISDYSSEHLLLEQIKWCITNKLYGTPKFFINGMALPSIYTVKEIDYMCT